MTSRFLISMIAFSITLNGFIFAEELFQETPVENSTAVEEKQSAVAKEEEVLTEPENRQVAFPKSETVPPKKIKPQFVGVKRPQPKVKASGAEQKKSSRVKNKWFSSKTHPKKVEKKRSAEEKSRSVQLASDRPHFIKTSHVVPGPLLAQQTQCCPAFKPLETEAQECCCYPPGGFQAPEGHFYFTGEWLYWQTRQEGMEFATAKKVNFGLQSGFRAGVGVHLPWDHWDVYVNYTRFTPEGSRRVHHSVFPLYLFTASSNVLEAHAHWNIQFQNLDVEIGRAYYIAKSLSFRPFIGMRGAWIHQHAHADYRGGFVAANQTYRTKFKNDFKGAGPLLGIESNWHLGAGLSLFGNVAAALVVGHFDNKQEQHQLDHAELINLNTAFNLVSPTAQMVAGLAWDRNFHCDRRHVGLSAGFETQYWWSQNQTELFTDSERPVYVREKGDLAFYGLTLRGRFDF